MSRAGDGEVDANFFLLNRAAMCFSLGRNRVFFFRKGDKTEAPALVPFLVHHDATFFNGPIWSKVVSNVILGGLEAQVENGENVRSFRILSVASVFWLVVVGRFCLFGARPA